MSKEPQLGTCMNYVPLGDAHYRTPDCAEFVPLPTDRATEQGTPHDHTTIVPGCYRCEIGQDEADRATEPEGAKCWPCESSCYNDEHYDKCHRPKCSCGCHSESPTPRPPLEGEGLRAIVEAATPGPWHWSGNVDFEDPSLCRWGNYGLEEVMSSVPVDRRPDDPRIQGLDDVFEDQADIDRTREEFLEDENGDPRTDRHLSFTVDGIKTSARSMSIFEVCPSATDRTDPRVYRADVTGVRHPDATFIATFDPAKVTELLDTIDTLSSELATTREERDRLAGELWDMAGDRANLLGALTHIAQFDPRWKGQHINTAPSRAQLIAVAFDALDASQKEEG